MKNNKEVIRELSKEQAKTLGLGTKTTNVLAFMVARKVRHPEEKMDELCSVCTKADEQDLSTVYGKTEG